MFRTRILLIVGAVALVTVLFLLPRGVVDNESEMAQSPEAQAMSESHQASDPAIRTGIKRLRLIVDNGPLAENKVIFADSLASLYASAGQFDSAAVYREKLASFIGTPESQVLAGDAWYQAYTFSMNAETRSKFALKAQEFYNAALKVQPSNADIKVKVALTYMETASPMQGVSLLREVLAENPKNEKALQNMGMLSIRSGQYAKAVEWLTKLTDAYPENIEGQVLLGAAYAGAGDKAKALAQYERTKTMTNDPAVQQQLDQYIKDLK